MSAGFAVMGGWVATELIDVTGDLAALDGAGWWAVSLPFDGPPLLARFARRRPAEPLRPRRRWPGLDPASWRSSLDRARFESGVGTIRGAIADGTVYQVNLTRRLSAALPPGADPHELAGLLAARHPAPHAGALVLPGHDLAVVSASPERFLRRVGRNVESRPIKGTMARADGETAAVAFGVKDRAENVMIVDLVRNDLGRVCEPGSVRVAGLCVQEHHPGLVHLVSTVRGRLRTDAGWGELLAATFPPGSVTGAPKLAALDLIGALEPVPRGPYCGALGWVDADAGVGDLNVAIRTFWVDRDRLHLGTGGGITWGSDPGAEWEETVLKGRKLIAAVERPW